ncbi:hypothetical protein [Dentiradicibacter hellwigii]|uniref:Uncharacterized protein n=1 Tax=Dentiradicibacter hellwigii TaxID=3149053 RepID=A0ABV4UCV9_9RHOO
MSDIIDRASEREELFRRAALVAHKGSLCRHRHDGRGRAGLLPVVRGDDPALAPACAAGRDNLRALSGDFGERAKRGVVK